MLTVSCPHCGFAKEIPADKVPLDVVRVTCPSCKESFPFGRNAADIPEPPAEEIISDEDTEVEREQTKTVAKAGFWIRVVARAVDFFITATMVTVLTLLLLFFASDLISSEQGQAALSLIIVIFIVTTIVIYDVFFLGYCGQTPGKMAVRIKVIRTDGVDLSYGRAFFREVIGKYVSRFLLFAGYLMVAFDGQKQGLHDKIADTYVIKL